MRRVYRWAPAVSVLVGVWLGIAVCAWAETAAPQNQITMNFQNVDIPVLAKFISEITGKNFIIDESVRGKVSIISPTKVTPEQAYQIFQSALQIKGYTTVQAAKIIKIVPARVVRQSAALTTEQQPALQRGDEYVTRMVKLRNVDASSIMGVVQPMVSHDGLIAAFPEDNTLIITDDAYNVGRLLRIIGSLDVQGVHQNVEVIPLKFAFADDLAPEVEQIMGGASSTSSGGGPQSRGFMMRPGPGVVAPSAQGAVTNFKVIPDERTNSLVAVGGPIQMKQIHDIVAKLDVEPPNATSRIHVYHLKNAPASQIVGVLNALMSGSGGPGMLSPSTGRGSLGRGSSLGLFNGSGMGGLGGAMMGGGMMSGYGGYGGSTLSGFGGGHGGGYGGGYGGGMMDGGGLSGGSAANTSATSAATSGKTAEFSNPVSVTADPATNSLVISAAPQDYVTLKKIVAELDVPRVQVFVQAIIVEVSAERARNMGVEFQSSSGLSGSTLGVGQLNFGNLQNALSNPLGLTGLGLGLASGSKCTIPVSSSSSSSSSSSTLTVPCDLALIEALETDTHTNVLSAPTLLTADNEEAMIVVGENLPFVGSAAANSALSGQIFNSVDRQNVGITLDIMPQVSEGDHVRLDLYEEVSNVVAGTESNTLGPTTTIRSASTTVIVQNHHTAVIGGLLSNNYTSQRQGVPWISDVPVLGNLFSSTSSDRQKDNLLVFLTPHIVRTKNDLRSLALGERQKFVNRLGPSEMKNMPTTQVRELYKPSFAIAVPPSAELNPPYGQAPTVKPAPAAPGETPFNTMEIGPSSNVAPAPPVAPVATGGGS